MGSDLRKDYYSTYTYELKDNSVVFKRQGYGRALIPNIFNYIDTNLPEGKWKSFQIRGMLRIRCIEYLIIHLNHTCSEVIVT